jgi:hypothetical protein
MRFPTDDNVSSPRLESRLQAQVHCPHIVKRELAPTDGKIKPTGHRGHHIWWAYDGIERHPAFELVETVPKS